MSIINVTAAILLAYVVTNDYSSTQVADTTMEQARTILGNDTPSQYTRASFKKIKRIVLQAVIENERTATKDAFEAQVKTWANNNFPDHVFDRRFDQGYLVIEFYPNGKPPE